ncbi:MAG: hypothetical protein ABSC94_32420 [Polyangiaceae bacterium]
MPAATAVRSSLVDALKADLVGPFEVDNAASAEVLRIAPSRWYLRGFLAPKADCETKDPTAEEELGTGADDEDENEPAPEPEPKQKNSFPASLGLSVLLPAAEAPDETVRVTVSLAEYVREDRDTGDRKRKASVWRRVPQPPRSVQLRLDATEVENGKGLPDTPSVRVCGKLEQADAPGLGPGPACLGVFRSALRRAPGDGRGDRSDPFQVRPDR